MEKIVGKVIGNTTSTPMAVPNWLQTDETKADFIKNKPDIDGTLKTVRDDITSLQTSLNKKASTDTVDAMVKEINENSEEVSRISAEVVGLSNEVRKVVSEAGYKELVANKVDFINENSHKASSYPNVGAVVDYVSEKIEEVKHSTGGSSGSSNIVGNAEGTVINIKDSAGEKFRKFSIYGKTTQEAEPNLDNWKPLDTITPHGNIATNMYGKNLFNPSFISTGNGYPSTVKLVLSNSYGTTIDSNTYDGNKIVVTQSAYDSANGAGSYKNGYFTIGLYNYELKFGREYTLVADINITNDLSGLGKLHAITQGSSQKVLTVSNNKVYYTFAFKENAQYPERRYIDVRVNGISCELSNIMLVEGNATNATIEYEPFKKQTLTMNVPNYALDGVPVSANGNYKDENGQQWVCDEIDLARGKKIQRVARVEFSGEEDWKIESSNDSNMSLERLYVTMPDAMALNNVQGGILCNYAPVGTSNWKNAENIGKVVVSGTDEAQISFVFNEGEYAVDTWKELLDDKYYNYALAVEILYILAEPVEIDLTPEEIAQYKALTIYKPVTNIYNDVEAHMSVEYDADTKAYIDNKFNELANAIITLGGK